MARNTMRSFIKGHIRSESSTSDNPDHEIDNSMRMGPYNGTQFPSPTFQQKPQFTSPQNKGIRTPKKLLTPIKNLFSSPSHSKQANGVLSSGDRLNGALTGPSKDRVNPPQRREPRRASELPLVGREAGFVNLGLAEGTMFRGTRKTESGRPVGTKNVYGSHDPKTSLSTPTLKHSECVANTRATFNSQEELLPRIGPPGSTAGETLAPPLTLGSPLEELDEKLANNSSISISDSKNFETKLVSFQTESLISEDKRHQRGAASGGDDTQDDEEYSDSDASEFSFVKDNAGGRNTSVKYYKTNKTPQINDKAFAQLNEFNEDDLGYEVDEFSDYDYENNGMDDEDDLNYDDEQDADVQYNNIFGQELNQDDYEAKSNNVDSIYSNNCDGVSALSSNPFDKEEIEIETASTDIKLPDLNVKRYRPFNHSYHLSIEGLDNNFISQESIPKHNIQDEDILENYMDSRRLSSVEGLMSSRRTPDLQSSGNLELYDLNSPLINGLTIGNNLRHRFRRDNDLKEDENDTNMNKLFIFRQASSESITDNFKPLGYKKGENDRTIFKQRVLKSFHSSISDSLDVKISSKLDAIESFCDRRTANQALNDKANITEQKDVGLGILLDLASSQCTDSTDTATSNKGVTETVDSSKEKQNAILPVIQTEAESNKSQEENAFDVGNQVSKDPRLSILGMMSILANLEEAQTLEGDNSKKEIEISDHKRRKSIIDMMDNLAIIESHNEQEKKSKRSSITNMMSTLAMLENSNNLNKDVLGTAQSVDKFSKKDSKNPLQRVASQAQNEKYRYSWYDDDEEINFKAVKNKIKQQREIPDSILATPPEAEKLHFENVITSLDKDLIDEANQLPEDFNFEEQDYPKYQKSPLAESFFRSNSYTKRPTKSVIDNNFLSNKIETVNKTITFYRSNSTGHFSEFNRSGSVSRGPSTRSMKSFTSLDSEIVEDKTGDHSKTNIFEVSNSPYTFRSNFPLHSKSTESHNLDTISEADSPAV